MSEMSYGFIPGTKEQHATLVRRRYRFTKGGNEQLMLVHYQAGHATRKSAHTFFPQMLHTIFQLFLLTLMLPQRGRTPCLLLNILEYLFWVNELDRVSHRQCIQAKKPRIFLERGHSMLGHSMKPPMFPVMSLMMIDIEFVLHGFYRWKDSITNRIPIVIC